VSCRLAVFAVGQVPPLAKLLLQLEDLYLLSPAPQQGVQETKLLWVS